VLGLIVDRSKVEHGGELKINVSSEDASL
jgi:hypothetical protein